MNHLNRQVFVLIIVTITIPLLIISAIIYVVSVQAVKNEYRNGSELLLTNLSYNIDQYLQGIEKSTLTALMDGRLQSSLEHWSTNTTDNIAELRVRYGNVIEDFVSSIEVTVKNVDSVQVYAADSVFYSANFNRSDYEIKDFNKEPWYQQTMAQKGGIVIFGSHLPFHRVDAQEPVISIARVINKVGTRQPLGVLLVDIRLDSLEEILSMSEYTQRQFVIVDREGHPVYASSDEIEKQFELGSKLKAFPLNQVLEWQSGSYYEEVNGTSSYINYITSDYSGWKVVQYIDEQEMTKHAKRIQSFVLALALGSFGMALLLLFILYSRVTKPIILLSKKVKQVGLGKFDVDLRSTRSDEFGVLYQGIHKMVGNLQEYIERSSIARAQQKVAQFGALKSQINPHFLANALESIQMKAVLSGQRDIAEMVGLLGRLFRSYIQTGKETVTLSEELTHTRLYVKVQQMRFGDKLQYREVLAEGSESAQIVHFSLQPIIENAIIHGLELKNGPGLLEVISELSDSALILTVRDDGIGMDKERLDGLRHRLQLLPDTLEQEHIGLKNVHDRIRFYFGEHYGIEIHSRLGEGTTVTVRMPYILL